MKTSSAHHIPIAVAVCSYSVPLPADNSADITLQLLPAGHFQPADGREIDVPSWFIDAAVATRVIERFNQRRQPVVVDYEHQTLHREANGQPAPAAAWIRELMWREGEGLFARAELTAKARNAIAAREYLYISPVFRYARTGGAVTELEMVALTNTPALHGMQELELRAAATFGFSSTDHPDHTEDLSMKLLAALISALSLAPSASEDEAIAALTARLQQDPLANLRASLGVAAGADEATLVAACTALRSAQPDPARYVPVSVVESIKGDLAVLTAKVAARDATDMESDIAAALADGRLLPAMEGWATDLGKTNRAALTAYLNTAQPLAALTASQTGGRGPAATGAALTPDELAICTHMGITAEQYQKARV